MLTSLTMPIDYDVTPEDEFKATLNAYREDAQDIVFEVGGSVEIYTSDDVLVDVVA